MQHVYVDDEVWDVDKQAILDDLKHYNAEELELNSPTKTKLSSIKWVLITKNLCVARIHTRF